MKSDPERDPVCIAKEDARSTVFIPVQSVNIFVGSPGTKEAVGHTDCVDLFRRDEGVVVERDEIGRRKIFIRRRVDIDCDGMTHRDLKGHKRRSKK